MADNTEHIHHPDLTQPGGGKGQVRLATSTASAVVDVEHGGMLVSIATAGRELLAQGQVEGQPIRPIPEHGSFLMAPWVAELYLGRLSFRGETYQLPTNVGRHAVHGLVMNGAWDVESRTGTGVTIVRELVDPWPFGGQVRQEIRLDDKGVTQIASVEARAQAMPASVGWHPWFRCESPYRSRLRVEATGRLDVDDELIPTGRVLALTGAVDLRAAPVFGERQIDVAFVGAVSPVEFAQPGLELTISFDSAISVVVVYSRAGTVCIEPWSAWPDAVRMGGLGFPSGAVVLEPGERLERWTRWAWTPSGVAGDGL